MASPLDYLHPSSTMDEARRRFRTGMYGVDEGMMEAQRRARLSRGIGGLDYLSASMRDRSVPPSLGRPIEVASAPTVRALGEPFDNSVSSMKLSKPTEHPSFANVTNPQPVADVPLPPGKGYSGPLPPDRISTDFPFLGEGDLGQAQVGGSVPEGKTSNKDKEDTVDPKSDKFSEAIERLLTPTSGKDNFSRTLLDLGLSLMATDRTDFLSAVGQAGLQTSAMADKRASQESNRLQTAGYLKQVESQIESAKNEKTKVRNIIMDQDGVQYAVTDDGVEVLTHKGKHLKTFNKNDPRYLNAINAYEEYIKNIWLSGGDVQDAQGEAMKVFSSAWDAAASKTRQGSGVRSYDPKTGKLSEPPT